MAALLYKCLSWVESLRQRMLFPYFGCYLRQKDRVRLPPDLQHQIKAVPYSLRLKDPEALWQALLRTLGQGQQGDV